MEHFQIISALIKSALDNDQDRVTHQTNRLLAALKKDDDKQAAKLERILQRQESPSALAPMSLEQMQIDRAQIQSAFAGEVLQPSTPLPHDKDSGAPLVRVTFPQENTAETPVLPQELYNAISDLLQEWSNISELARIGVAPNTRCLLFGAPGVGKTLLAHFIAKKLGLPILEARLDGMVSSFLGTTARNIGALFDFANRFKCVLFLDEFDAVAKARDDRNEIGEIKRVVNTLLQSLDARGQRGFTIAATNHEHLLDTAVWRRFDARIEIPKPSPKARKEIFQKYLAPLRIAPFEVDFLVWLSEDMSASDIQTLVAGGKRYIALHGRTAAPASQGSENVTRTSRSEALIAAIKRQATLNSSLFSETKRGLLLSEDDDIVFALQDEVGLTQSQIASLLGKSQSTISRLKKDPHR